MTERLPGNVYRDATYPAGIPTAKAIDDGARRVQDGIEKLDRERLVREDAEIIGKGGRRRNQARNRRHRVHLVLQGRRDCPQHRTERRTHHERGQDEERGAVSNPAVGCLHEHHPAKPSRGQ